MPTVEEYEAQKKWLATYRNTFTGQLSLLFLERSRRNSVKQEYSWRHIHGQLETTSGFSPKHHWQEVLQGKLQLLRGKHPWQKADQRNGMIVRVTSQQNQVSITLASGKTFVVQANSDHVLVATNEPLVSEMVDGVVKLTTIPGVV